MQLFDAPPGEAAPADLTPGLTVEPDNAFTLNWHLQGDENPLMPCRYDGSATYYRAYPRPSPTSYTLRNDNGLTRAWCEAP